MIIENPVVARAVADLNRIAEELSREFASDQGAIVADIRELAHRLYLLERDW